MAKKRRPPLSPEEEALKALLHPVVEITPQIRPQWLLVLPRDTGPLILGLLYHTRKRAWQWRLRLHTSTQPGFTQRSHWLRYDDIDTMEKQMQTRIADFIALADQLGTPLPIVLEFPERASDAEIWQALWDTFPSTRRR